MHTHSIMVWCSPSGCVLSLALLTHTQWKRRTVALIVSLKQDNEEHFSPLVFYFQQCFTPRGADSLSVSTFFLFLSSAPHCRSELSVVQHLSPSLTSSLFLLPRRLVLHLLSVRKHLKPLPLLFSPPSHHCICGRLLFSLPFERSTSQVFHDL